MTCVSFPCAVSWWVNWSGVLNRRNGRTSHRYIFSFQFKITNLRDHFWGSCIYKVSLPRALNPARHIYSSLMRSPVGMAKAQHLYPFHPPPQAAVTHINFHPNDSARSVITAPTWRNISEVMLFNSFNSLFLCFRPSLTFILGHRQIFSLRKISNGSFFVFFRGSPWSLSWDGRC